MRCGSCGETGHTAQQCSKPRIPIEERDPAEVTDIFGVTGEERHVVRTTAPETRAANPAFDVTPARLVTGLITERGICDASERGLAVLFPEQARR